MAIAGESFRVGQAPFLLQRHAHAVKAAVELVHAGVTRTFTLAEGKVVGFSSSSPEEELKPGLDPTEASLVPAIALARLVAVSGEYRVVEPKAPLVPLALPLSWVILEALRRTQDLSPVLDLLGTSRPFVRTGSNLNPSVSLVPLEAFVWDRLGSPLTLADLQRLLPEQTQPLSRAFAALACAGLLVPADAPPPKPEKPRFPPASPKLRERLARIAREGGLPALEADREPTEEELEQAQRDKEQALALLAQGGDERQAVRLLSRAVSLLPDPHSLVRLAEVEVANPLWRQRALAHLKQALEMEPTFTPAWLALANYWALRGDTEKQRRCLENVLKYDPQNRDVREALLHLG